jgi:hypothetical protein
VQNVPCQALSICGRRGDADLAEQPNTCWCCIVHPPAPYISGFVNSTDTGAIPWSWKPVSFRPRPEPGILKCANEEVWRGCGSKQTCRPPPSSCDPTLIRSSRIDGWHYFAAKAKYVDQMISCWNDVVSVSLAQAAIIDSGVRRSLHILILYLLLP